LRPGGQHGGPAALPGGPDRAGGAAHVLGLHPAVRPHRGACPPGRATGLDGGVLAGRPGGPAGAFGGDLRHGVFGDAVEPGRSAAVGMGLHAFRDPDVVEDFAAVRLPIDVAEPHDYAVDWTPDRAELRVDGAVVRTVTGPP